MTHILLHCDGVDFTMCSLESGFTDAASMPNEKRIREKQHQNWKFLSWELVCILLLACIFLFFTLTSICAVGFSRIQIVGLFVVAKGSCNVLAVFSSIVL